VQQEQLSQVVQPEHLSQVQSPMIADILLFEELSCWFALASELKI